MALLGKSSKGNRRVARAREVSRGEVWRRLGRVLLVLAAVGGAAAGLPLAGWFGYRAVLSSGYFAPSTVQVHGNTLVTPEAVIEAAGLDAAGAGAGVNLIEFDEAEAAARIEALPWIASAQVETRLPDTVEITVSERQLLGTVREDQLYRVDLEGAIIEPWQPSHGVPQAIISGAGLLGGDGAAARSRVLQGFEIARLYKVAGLERWAQLSEVHYDAQLGWTVFAHETEVRLGHDRFAQRLERLWQVFVLLDERGTRPEYVLLDLEDDLDRVAVKPYPRVVEAAPQAPLDAGGDDAAQVQ